MIPTYGALWANEDVFHMTKEIQLVKPDQFVITTNRKLFIDGRNILGQMFETWRRLMTFVSLHSIGMLSSWT